MYIIAGVLGTPDVVVIFWWVAIPIEDHNGVTTKTLHVAKQPPAISVLVSISQFSEVKPLCQLLQASHGKACFVPSFNL